MPTKSPITMLSSSMLVALHNQLIDIWELKIKTVKKFSDRVEAEKRLIALCKSMPTERQAQDLPVALRKICAPSDVIEMMEKIAANPKGRSHTPHIPAPGTSAEPRTTSPPDASSSVAPEPQPDTPSAPANKKALSGKAAVVLKAVRELIGDKQGEKAQTDSAAVSNRLKASSSAVCKILDALYRFGHIEVEDDTTGDDQRFMYIHLTETGRTCELNLEPAAAPEPPVNGKPARKPLLPSSSPGPNCKFDGKKIFKLVKENPRRAGTHGFDSFALIKEGMPFESYRAAGGRNVDLQWDVDHKFVEVR